ncbi:DUF3397 domain-containing protein [Listeria sp. ILCC797]|uniref:DUF3397 domain-containing protein n=1 Tax=Listeria sp. ILCC797 TaxID=1918333 RepID=UPI000B5900B1|nr:DUF3397 domain-containing protein [Listeria sp. ILCC797]
MFNWLTDTTFVLIVLPVIVFLIVFWTVRFLLKQPRRELKLAADFTTLFLIIAVHLFMKLLFNHSFLLYIFLFLFIIGIVIIALFAKRDGEIHVYRTIRIYWRICFFVFSLLYIALFLTGLVMSVVYLLG